MLVWKCYRAQAVQAKLMYLESSFPEDIRAKLVREMCCCSARPQGSSALWMITVIICPLCLLSWDMGHDYQLCFQRTRSIFSSVSGVILIQCYHLGLSQVSAEQWKCFFPCWAVAVQAEGVRWGKHPVKDWLHLQVGCVGLLLSCMQGAAQTSLSSSPATWGLLAAAQKL